MKQRVLEIGALSALLTLVAPLSSFGTTPIPTPRPEKPTGFHVYLHIHPVQTFDETLALQRRQSVTAKVTAALQGGENGNILSGSKEQLLDGHHVVRWTVGAWTPTQAHDRISAARALFRPQDKVTLVLTRVDHRTVEIGDPAVIEDKLKTDLGALHEWYKERFGPSFPWELLTSENGGSYFDLSAIREGTPGLDSAGVLFDATGRPRTAESIDERIRLAKSTPRVQPGTSRFGDGPPPPLKFETYVLDAADDAETQDVLRGIIYASHGYGDGFAKGSGLYGPMGLSKPTFKWAQRHANAEQKEILTKGILDDRANILAGAIIYESIQSRFRWPLNRKVAAFHVGAGNVRTHGGIPADATHYVDRFQLAHQQGIRRALDPSSPRVVRRIEPVTPVSPIGAILRRIQEEASILVRGEPPTGRRNSFVNVPPNLVEDIYAEATTGKWQTNPNALIALSEAEGGVTAGTSHANARGVLQITPETALWECGLSRADLAVRSKNIACAEKVFTSRLEKADGDIVLAWALYNTKVKWHGMMIREQRVANIKETVRHVTRAAYRYFQLTGDASFDPGTRAFREKYFKTVKALNWSAQSYIDIQKWDRNEGFRGQGVLVSAERVPALEGTGLLASGPARSAGGWRRNSTGTHWYRRSAKSGQRWDLHRYRNGSGQVTNPPA